MGIRKYFFSYHLVMGEPFALMWVEEDGICVGGRPSHLVGDLVEITEEEFNTGELSPLEKQFPLELPMKDILLTKSNDPNGV